MNYSNTQELTYQQEFDLYIEAQEKETDGELEKAGFNDAYNSRSESDMFDYSEAYRRGYGRGYVALIALERLKAVESNNEDVPF